MKLKRDTITGLMFLAYSGFCFLQISKLGKNAVKGGAAVFPKIVVWTMLVFSLVLIAQSMLNKNGKAAIFNKQACVSVVALVAMIAVYIFLIPRVGYLLASVLFFIPVLLLYGLKKAWVVSLLGIGVPVLFFIIFKFILKVPLP